MTQTGMTQSGMMQSGMMQTGWRPCPMFEYAGDQPPSPRRAELQRGCLPNAPGPARPKTEHADA
jgi:hypothetical protein